VQPPFRDALSDAHGRRPAPPGDRHQGLRSNGRFWKGRQGPAPAERLGVRRPHRRRRPRRRGRAGRPRGVRGSAPGPTAFVPIAGSCRPAALAAGESAAERRLHMKGTPYPSYSPARQAPPLDPGPAGALDLTRVVAAQLVGALTRRAAGARRAGAISGPTTRSSTAGGRRFEAESQPTAASPSCGAIGLRRRGHLPCRG
jgi:hypothetical protein